MRRLVAVLISLCCFATLVPAAARAASCTAGSTSSAGGDWDNAPDWSNGTPSLQCETVITGTVTSHGGATQGLEIDSGSLSVEATTDGLGHPVPATLDDRGPDTTIAVGGALLFQETGANPGQVSIAGSSHIVNGGSVATTAPATAPTVLLSAWLNNTAMGSVSIGADTQSGSATYVNNGSWTVSASATMTFGGNGGGPSLSQVSGTYANTGTTRLTNGSVTHSGGNITGNPIRLCQATANPSGPGSAAFEFDQLPGCSGGNIGSDIGAGDTVRVLKSDTVGGALTVNSGAFTNHGVLELGGTGTGDQDQLIGAGVLTNQGTLTLSQARDLAIQKAVVNQGTLTVASATTALVSNAFTQASGTTTLASGSHMSVTDFTITGGQFVDGGDLAGSGDLIASGGQVTGNPPTFSRDTTLSGSGAGTFVLGGGHLRSDVPAGYHLIVDASLGIEGTTPSGVVNHGTIELRGGGGLNPNLFDRPLDNQGTLSTSPSAADYRVVNSSLTQEGVLAVGADVNIPNALTNTGFIDVTGGASLMVPSFAQSVGTTTLHASGDRLHSSGPVTVTGGTLGGAGTVEGNLTNGGTVRPAPSPSTFTVSGSYMQTSAGFLAATVAAAGNDRLHVTGAATLGGTLQVTTAAGYIPPKDQTYTVADAASVSGTFATTAGLDSGPYSLAYSPSAVTLTALAQPAGPPVVPTLSIGDATVANPRGGSAVASFTLTLSAASLDPVTVHYATANGTASAPAQYLATAGDVTIAPGQTTATVPVTVIGDSTAGARKTFFLDLSAPSGATLSHARGTATILGQLTLTRVSPGEGGNAGTTELVVEGAGLSSSDSVMLTAAGKPAIAATGVDATADGRTLTALLPLAGAPLGARDVTVTSGTGGGAATLPGAFRVATATLPVVRGVFSGRPTVRPGTRYTGFVEYHNSGNVDAENTLVEVDGLPANAAVSIGGNVSSSAQKIDDGQREVSFVIPRIGSGAYGSVAITTAVGNVAPHSYPIDAHVDVLQSSAGPLAGGDGGATMEMTSAELDARGYLLTKAHLTDGTDQGDIEAETYLAPARPSGPTFSVTHSGDDVTYLTAVPLSAGSSGATANCVVSGDVDADLPVWACGGAASSRSAALRDFTDDAEWLIEKTKFIGKHTAKLGEEAYHLYHTGEAALTNIEAIRAANARVAYYRAIDRCLANATKITPSQQTALDASAGAATGIAAVNLLASIPTAPGGLLGALTVGKAREIAIDGASYFADEGWKQQVVSFVFGLTPDSPLDLHARRELFRRILKLCGETARSKASPVQANASGDPNDMVGPAGPTAKHWVSGARARGNYTAFFENLPTAGAPAYSVTVADKLDASKLDLATVALGPVTIANTILTPPPGLTSWSTQLDMRPGRDALVDATGSLTGDTIEWRFTTVDPATHQPVNEVDAGFLPPDTMAPNGEGSVSFSVLPKAGLANGAATDNSASIVFDTNAAIRTPAWRNTVDLTRPSSRFTRVRSRRARKHRIQLRWKGRDTGSGVGGFDLTVARGKHATPLLASGRSVRISCKRGARYRFTVRAQDRVGNLQKRAARSRRVRCR